MGLLGKPTILGNPHIDPVRRKPEYQHKNAASIFDSCVKYPNVRVFFVLKHPDIRTGTKIIRTNFQNPSGGLPNLHRCPESQRQIFPGEGKKWSIFSPCFFDTSKHGKWVFKRL